MALVRHSTSHPAERTQRHGWGGTKPSRGCRPFGAAAPAAWQSSPPCGGRDRGSAGWLPSGARCDAAICPQMGDKRKSLAHARNDVNDPTRKSIVHRNNPDRDGFQLASAPLASFVRWRGREHGRTIPLAKVALPLFESHRYVPLRRHVGRL